MAELLLAGAAVLYLVTSWPRLCTRCGGSIPAGAVVCTTCGYTHAN